MLKNLQSVSFRPHSIPLPFKLERQVSQMFSSVASIINILMQTHRSFCMLVLDWFDLHVKVCKMSLIGVAPQICSPYESSEFPNRRNRVRLAGECSEVLNCRQSILGLDLVETLQAGRGHESRSSFLRKKQMMMPKHKRFALLHSFPRSSLSWQHKW